MEEPDRYLEFLTRDRTLTSTLDNSSCAFDNYNLLFLEEVDGTSIVDWTV
jgi:hypothetical protein